MPEVPTWWKRYASGVVRSREDFTRNLEQAREVRQPPMEDLLRFLGELPDENDYRAPLARLAAPGSFFTATHHLAQHERADWQQTDFRIRLFAASLIERCRKLSIPLFVHCAFRTPAEQDALRANGFSQASGWYAAHVQGAAVDIIHARHAWGLTKNEWRTLGKLGEDTAKRLRIDVTWGGRFRSIYDPAHWELADWRGRADPKVTVGSPLRLTPRGILKAT